ncbi:hypothetical protein BN381_210081 [Candidatus Microthrix parvicella RN1]|uniref:Uncharacterized protein n=1 Tax=Candidatus Neomicrothrix parvicella RN1 TaxID=1229780 RepID=R4Z297_9ACTN|nr:hypothetical protein BN381_210081 [Candidatus Microthrix parvicella RN1]
MAASANGATRLMNAKASAKSANSKRRRSAPSRNCHPGRRPRAARTSSSVRPSFWGWSSLSAFDGSVIVVASSSVIIMVRTAAAVGVPKAQRPQSNVGAIPGFVGVQTRSAWANERDRPCHGQADNDTDGCTVFSGRRLRGGLSPMWRATHGPERNLWPLWSQPGSAAGGGAFRPEPAPRGGTASPD